MHRARTAAIEAGSRPTSVIANAARLVLMPAAHGGGVTSWVVQCEDPIDAHLRCVGRPLEALSRRLALTNASMIDEVLSFSSYSGTFLPQPVRRRRRTEKAEIRIHPSARHVAAAAMARRAMSFGSMYEGNALDHGWLRHCAAFDALSALARTRRCILRSLWSP